jgi:pimeloyl-ACP methyl ester carboxylesterase
MASTATLRIHATVTNDNLEAISVPPLMAHPKDDQLASHDASRRAAERIPDARSVSLESGGHPDARSTEGRRNELAAFVAERSDRCAERVGVERR